MRNALLTVVNPYNAKADAAMMDSVMLMESAQLASSTYLLQELLAYFWLA